jgi:hypothetical protein
MIEAAHEKRTKTPTTFFVTGMDTERRKRKREREKRERGTIK